MPENSAFNYPITAGFGPTSEKLDGPGSYKGQWVPNMNKGYDFGAPAGAPVPAVTPGTVLSAGYSEDGWGVSVKVRDQNGFIHNYGHLGNLNVRPGDTIERGQLIGAVGAKRAGERSTGPHLSYDVKPADRNEYVDPSPWLGGQGGSNMVMGTGGRQGDEQGGGSTFLALLDQQIAATARAIFADDRSDGTKTDALIATLTQLRGLRKDEEGKYTPIDLGLKQYELERGAANDEGTAATARYNAETMRFNAEQTAIDKDATRQEAYQKNLLFGPTNEYTIRLNEAKSREEFANHAYTNALNEFDRVALGDTKHLQQAQADVVRWEKGKQESRQRASEIDKMRMAAADKALPPGTEYCPGYEPTGLFAQVAQNTGLKWDSELYRVPEGATNATAGITINPVARLLEQDTAMGVPGGAPVIPPYVERTPPPIPGQTALPDSSALLAAFGNYKPVEPPRTGMEGYPVAPPSPNYPTVPNLAGLNAGGGFRTPDPTPPPSTPGFQPSVNGRPIYPGEVDPSLYWGGAEPPRAPQVAPVPQQGGGGNTARDIGLGIGAVGIGGTAAALLARQFLGGRSVNQAGSEVESAIRLLNPPRYTENSYGPTPPPVRGVLPEGNRVIDMPMPDERQAGNIPSTPYREVPYSDAIPMPPRANVPQLSPPRIPLPVEIPNIRNMNSDDIIKWLLNVGRRVR